MSRATIPRPGWVEAMNPMTLTSVPTCMTGSEIELPVKLPSSSASAEIAVASVPVRTRPRVVTSSTAPSSSLLRMKRITSSPRSCDLYPRIHFSPRLSRITPIMPAPSRYRRDTSKDPWVSRLTISCWNFSGAAASAATATDNAISTIWRDPLTRQIAAYN